MKIILANFCLLVPLFILSQVLDSTSHTQKDTSIATDRSTLAKPSLLTSGFIDIINTGQVNASARLIRLYIGEPGIVSIPLTIYSGVSSNSFQNLQTVNNQSSNDLLVSNFINPLSGLGNVSINDIVFLKRSKIKLTRTGLLYHAGERILTGYKTNLSTDPSTTRPVNFLNTVGVAGLYFQTGAWEKSNARSIGISWIVLRYIICSSSAKQLREIFSLLRSAGVYSGWSLAWGIAISDLLDAKVVYYKYIHPPEVASSWSIYQFSFNYSLKN